MQALSLSTHHDILQFLEKKDIINVSYLSRYYNELAMDGLLYLLCDSIDHFEKWWADFKYWNYFFHPCEEDYTPFDHSFELYIEGKWTNNNYKCLDDSIFQTTNKNIYFCTNTKYLNLLQEGDNIACGDFLDLLQRIIGLSIMKTMYKKTIKCKICGEIIGNGQYTIYDKNRIFMIQDGLIHYYKNHQYKPSNLFRDFIINSGPHYYCEENEKSREYFDRFCEIRMDYISEFEKSTSDKFNYLAPCHRRLKEQLSHEAMYLDLQSG